MKTVVELRVLMSMLLISMSLTSINAYSYSNYSDYLRAYNRCERPAAGKSDCQNKVNARYNCATKAPNEDQCLRNHSVMLYEEVQKERAAHEAQEAERQARLDAKKVQREAQNVVWAQQVEPRKAYGVGKWLVREGSSDPIDDSRVVLATLRADSGVSRVGGEPVALSVRCKSNKTEFFINWHSYVTDSTLVTHRFDKEEPVSKTWASSTDKTASFYYGSGVEIAKKLMTADRFVVRTTPYNENPVTAIFDTRGLSAAIEPLREACGW